MIDLCAFLSQPFHPAAAGVRPPSNYVSQFATYAAANLESGLRFRIEGGPNGAGTVFHWNQPRQAVRNGKIWR
jgi:hypothetical protein